MSTTGTTGRAPTAGQATRGASTAGTPGASTGAPSTTRPPTGAGPTPEGLASGMTPVPGAVTCTVTRDLEAAQVPVRPDRLWTDLRESSFGAREIRSRHQPGCAVPRPVEPDCTVSFPFAVQDQQDVVLAFGLDRLVTGSARATLSRTASARAPERILSYTVLVPPADVTGKGASSWLRAAVERCVGGRPGRLGGVAGLVGSLASPDASPGRARSLFVVEAGRAVWVVLDGGSWTPETERQAVQTAVTGMLVR